MRKSFAVILGAVALAVPNVNAWAAATQSTPLLQSTVPKKKVVTATRTFTGNVATADRWGDLQVVITVKKTTTTVIKTKKKTVTRKITAVKVPLSPNHTDRSIYINGQALPMLVQETISAQSANIDMVSGATDSSDAFQQSLQSALLKARAW